MKKAVYLLFITIVFNACSDMLDSGINKPEEQQTSADSSIVSKEKIASVTSSSDVWVGAYLASYSHYVEPTGNWGNLPTEEIDWDAFTHLFYFSLKANADGSLSKIAAYENVSPDRINAIVKAAHQNDKPVLFTVGGWGNYEGFSNAIKPANRAVFIANIVSILETWGFDGVDLDLEPINSGDTDNYITFINELNTTLKSIDVPLMDEPLISVVTNWHPDLFAKIHDKVDQINLMTYDLSGAWEGWVSWHNAAVSSGGLSFPSNGKPLPSIEEKVKAFVQAGVPASKLGIGIDFYGYVWSGGSGTSTGGVTKPNQSWDTAPTVTDNVPYHEIMNKYYQSGNYYWDDQAKAAYLSIDQSGSSNDKFISYDDEKSIRAKFEYARSKGLGGTIIWELAGGYRKDQPAGERDNLLQAVKQAWNNGSGSGGSGPDLDATAPSVSWTNPSDGSTVNGTVEIDINATDDTGVSSVELFIDGNSVKNFTSAPYTFSWNTTNHANQSSAIKVVASDAAGNSTSRTINVTVDNSTSGSSSSTAVYDESLNTPWINASWSATVDFNNSENARSGSKSVKVVQNSWGALSVHSGRWGQGQAVDPADFEAIEFAVYSPSQQLDLKVMFENDNGQSFPKVPHSTIPAGKWVNVRIPMSDMNPNDQNIHRIDILETSGSQKTYYVDDLKFVGSGSSSGSSSGSDSGSDSGDGSTTDQSEQDPGSFVDIYSDQLDSPWINTSWNASVDYNNTEQVKSGNNAIKVVQNAWGSLSVHSGNWGQSRDIDPSIYEAVEFSAYATSSGTSINVKLENDNGQSFPGVSHGTIPAGQWTVVSIPMNELNPNANTIHRLDIMEASGTKKTFYVDEVRLIKK